MKKWIIRRGGGGVGIDPISADLAWYYKFNGNSLRSYGTNNGGDANVNYVSGLIGQAAQYSGANDSFTYIDHSDDFDLGSGDFTICIWVKPSVLGARQIFMGQCNYSGANISQSFFYEITATDKFKAYFVDTVGSIAVVCTSTTSATIGDWFLLGVKRTGGNVYFKVNDVLEDTQSISGSLNASTYKMGIGCLGEYRAGFFFTGEIDIFSGWKRALTNQEQTDLYNGGLGWEFNSHSPVVSSNPLQYGFVDVNTIGFSTFQCNNQKTVKSAAGLFSVIWNASTNPTSNTYTLRISADDGETWTILNTGSFFTHQPLLEIDSNNDLFLLINDDAATAKLYKILHTDYTTLNLWTSITGIVAHKHCMNSDEDNNRIYYYVSNKMHIIEMSTGTLLNQTTILQTGTYEVEYPFLSIDSNSGDLYMLWVTAASGSLGDYKTINTMVSRDLALTWENYDGTPLTTPIVCDNTGPTQLLSLIGELLTNKFCSGFVYANERIHVTYWLNDVSVCQRYLRVNPTTGVVEITTDLIFSGSPNPAIYDLVDGCLIRSEPDGTFASPQPIYAFGAISPNLISIETADNGATWINENTIENTLGYRIYSIGGYRKTYNGKAYGVLTLVNTNSVLYSSEFSGVTYLFKLTT